MCLCLLSKKNLFQRHYLQLILDFYKNTKIKDNRFELLSLLHLISIIVNNDHRFRDFFSKIERILKYFKEDIKKYFSNSGIFNIFVSNKRILLFLHEYIVKKIITTRKFIDAKYPQYFQPEIQPFINEKWFPRYNPNDKELKQNE